MASKTLWHRLLGKLLELLLSSVEITVLTDFKVMSDTPRGDILLIRRETPTWTKEQLARLPDGLRETRASHILVEFKFSESLTHRVLVKSQGYEIFYKESQGLGNEAVQSFIVSAKTPQSAYLKRYGYEPSEAAGVYKSHNVMLVDLPIIVLNELSDAPHNAYVKCFASRRKEREKAFVRLAGLGGAGLSQQLWWFMIGLRQTMQMKGVTDEMKVEVTAEDVMNLGEGLRARLLETIPVEERLRGLKPEERLVGLKPEERLVGLKPEERLSGLESYVERQGLLKGLQRTLRIRFKLEAEALSHVVEQLEPLELAELETLSEIALTVETLAEFEAGLRDIQQRG